jgi:hypothetical protein
MNLFNFFLGPRKNFGFFDQRFFFSLQRMSRRKEEKGSVEEGGTKEMGGFPHNGGQRGRETVRDFGFGKTGETLAERAREGRGEAQRNTFSNKGRG